MANEQRKALQQLMGEDAMTGDTSHQKALEITDPKVCRSYLCGACPHNLFTNTKDDQGPCRNTHMPSLKEKYEAASPGQKRAWGFEWDYQRDIGNWVSRCDGKIRELQRKLEKTAEEVKQYDTLSKQIDEATANIMAGLAEVEVLCELGEVNLAVQEFHKLKLTKLTKEERVREREELRDNSGSSGHQKLQVCDVCSAYLSRLDNDRRLADHFIGKLHVGYAQMRKELKRLDVELAGQAPPVQPRHNDRYGGGYDDRGYGNGDRYGGGGGFHGGRRDGGGGYRGGRGRGRGGGNRW